jgi:ATP synthase F1 complex assembly factor 1
LDSIVKVALLKNETKERVEEIWTSFYREKEHNIAQTWTKKDFEELNAAAKKLGRFFIFPVAREGGHFVVLSQVQDKHVLFTFLDDYKADPHGAQPYLTVTFYDELAATKDLVLVRGDIQPHALTAPESARLVDLVRSFYLDKPGDVESFNKGNFDFEGHIQRLLA